MKKEIFKVQRPLFTNGDFEYLLYNEDRSIMTTVGIELFRDTLREVMEDNDISEEDLKDEERLVETANEFLFGDDSTVKAYWLGYVDKKTKTVSLDHRVEDQDW